MTFAAFGPDPSPVPMPPGQKRMAANYPPIVPPKPQAHPVLVDAKGRKTYTFAEYHAATGGDHAGYQKYLTYVHNVRAAKDAQAPPAASPTAATPFDPNDPSTYPAFAPVTPQQGMADATKAGNTIYQPQITSENQNYIAEQKRQADLIQRYTTGLASFLQNAPTGSEDFNRVQAGLAAGNAALGHAAVGQAAEGQDALAAFLTSIGAPHDSSKFATDIGARGQSVAGDVATAGQAALEGGAQRQGGLSQFLSTLPTIAAVGGRRTLADQLSGLATAHRKTVGDLRTSLASAIQKEYDTFQNRELQKAAALSGYAGTYASILGRQGVANTRAAATANAATARLAGAVYKRQPDGSVWRFPKDGSEPSQYLPPGSIKAPKTKAAASKNAQWEDAAAAEADSIASKAAGHHKVATTKTSPNPNNAPGYVGPPVVTKGSKMVQNSSYRKAIQRVRARVHDQLKRAGFSEDAITLWVQQHVNHYFPDAEVKRG